MYKRLLTKIQNPFVINALERLGIQRTYLNMMNAICNNSMANIKIDEKKLKTISL